MRKPPKSLLAFGLSIGIALLTACGGGGGGSSAPTTPGGSNPAGPSQGPTSTPAPAATTIGVGYGETNGSAQSLLISTAQNTHSYSGGGNLMPGQSGATSAGGGQGSAVDGIPCASSMSGDYHVHFFVGIIYNGQQVSVPAGVGMVDPYPPNQYVYNGNPVPGPTAGAVPNQSWTASCYYDMHVHDDSGMIHVETAYNTPQLCGAASGNPPTQECNYAAPYTLKTFFDIWGINVTTSNFGPLTGPVLIYTTPAGYNSYSACGASSNDVIVPCSTTSTSYAPYTGSLSQLEAQPIYSHSVYWFVIGTPNPAGSSGSGLPNINWVEGDP
ncbi:MAG TPA: hypothetical protein VGG22_15745 [Candidatus Baltobacteraceae bacterium]|jgi:hypothetical protein